MPASYALEGAVLRLVLVDETDFEELFSELDRALADAACPERPVLLIDLRRSTSLSERSPHEIRLVARMLQHRERIGRKAFLATPGVRYGMARMVTSYVEIEGGEARSFLREPAALTWLRAVAATA